MFSFSYGQADSVKWGTQGNIADSTSFIGTKNSACLSFRSNNLERMRITNNGNVGIGILNPTKKFEVNGNTLINGDFFLPSLDTIANIETGKFLFVNENGKIFKGSVEQLKALIFGELGMPGVPLVGVSDPVPIDICQLAGGYQQNPTWINAPYKLYTLCPDVKVGIGTDSPNYTLDVNGSVRIKDSTRTNWLKVGLGSFNSNYILKVNGSAKIKGETLTDRLRVGKVTSETGLITGYYRGTTSSTYNLLNIGVYNPQNSATTPILTLDAKGNLKLSNKDKVIFFVDAENSTPTLRARRIVVDLHTWSDYVFQKDYSLPSLLETEKYIDENGHLPGVPSESEVLENGVDLAEMNTILLKKIEELTLYVINQQKEIEKLKEAHK